MTRHSLLQSMYYELHFQFVVVKLNTLLSLFFHRSDVTDVEVSAFSESFLYLTLFPSRLYSRFVTQVPMFSESFLCLSLYVCMSVFPSRLYSRFVTQIDRMKGNVKSDAEGFHDYVVKAIHNYKQCFLTHSIRQCAFNQTLKGMNRVNTIFFLEHTQTLHTSYSHI